MSLELPSSLTPSKVSMFKECALAFRLSAIDRVPEPASEQAFKGTVVHRALELLMWEQQQGDRSRQAAYSKLDRALAELLEGQEGSTLGLAGQRLDDFASDAKVLLDNYFELEDPDEVRVIGTEVRLEVHLNGLCLRGIIDRLEIDEDGALVITDYKTGRAPGVNHEQARLGGVHFYAFLCEQVLGTRPARAQLLHLREPMSICSVPSDQSIAGLERQALAIWAAVTRACEAEDFRPRPGPMCDWCGYHAYCPSVGGDLALVGAGSSSPPAELLP